MFRIYLAGYINNEVIDKCVEWRKQIALYFNSNPKWQGVISFLDPLNGDDMKNITEEGLKCSLPGKALIHRDYNSIRSADLIVANLDTFGEDRPIVGTVFELAWAWEFKKPVIVITDDDKYKFHPFIMDTASIIVSNVEELLEKKYINFMFKGQNNAIYT
jgi:nucleoside 2-deoxyribosyltransferase